MRLVDDPLLRRLPDVLDIASGTGELRQKIRERPIVSLESITLSNETVAVSGTVSPAFVLAPDLIINGHLVPIDSGGRFWAVVRLAGYDGLSLSLATGIHGTVTFELPLKAS